MSRLSWEHEQYLERQEREAQYQRREEERDAAEARTALEMAFEERAGCVEACFDACVHTPECMSLTAEIGQLAGVFGSEQIAAPVAIALAGWRLAMRVAQARPYPPTSRPEVLPTGSERIAVAIVDRAIAAKRAA